MNPLDWPGPAFLGLYVVLLLAAVVVALYLHRSLRQPGGEPSEDDLDLSPYEVAFLAGGEVLTVNAALARLIQEKLLAVDSAKRRLTRCGAGQPGAVSELERSVLDEVSEETGQTIAKVRHRAAWALGPIERRLRDLGSFVSEVQVWKVCLIPPLVILAVVLFGVLKIFVGVSRQRPVAVLEILCIMSGIVAMIFIFWPVRRSRRGDRVLALLKDANAALELSGRRRPDDLAGDDLVMALGLFGMDVLAGGPLTELQTALRPPPNFSGDAHCGGGCGGGGGCGSGCGGCGG
jgi:uncharacterized protein (TIGR04222 family)